ncbi:MAG TPA: hypothetical protein VGU43_06725 [Thermoplasmata archaeon]|nr:hypothetical protein [Thermoplasmata archaeon]
MPVPGPGGAAWGVELLLFGLLCLPLGELLRRVLGGYIGLFRGSSAIERGLLDLYLAGGALYLVGWLPLEYPETPAALLGVGAGLWGLIRRRAISPEPPADWSELLSATGALLAALSFGLFLLEIVAAESAPSGNTFDSSILSAYVGLTGLHHQLPSSLAPIAPQAIAYPQGATAWFYAAQAIFGVPSERTALLVTPLFLALAPVGAYLWGRAWWGSTRAGLILAGLVVLFASWPRLLVSGSNDFVLSFPLVLLLWSWTPRWFRATPPGAADAVGFGLTAGLAASLSPTGPEVWFLALPLAWSLLPSSRGADVRRRWSAGLISLLVALLVLLPSLSVIARSGGGSAGLPSQIPSPTGAPLGLTSGQLVGLLDPFLFRSSDVWLSPFPIVRAELALLLGLGAALLVLDLASRPARREWKAAGGGLAMFSVGAALLLLQLRGEPSTSLLAGVTNTSEISILLLTLLLAVVVVPLLRLGELLATSLPNMRGSEAPRRPGEARSTVGAPQASPSRRAGRLALLLAVGTLVVLPGVVVSATDAPGYLHGLYVSVGNTSGADYELLEWATGHLPAGARVLAAPGSAAQFLAGLRPDLALVYPVEPVSANRSYLAVTSELDSGTLDAAGRGDLSVLAIQYIAVTQANNRLWPAYSPAPLLAAPSSYPLLFESGDAYLFSVAAT